MGDNTLCGKCNLPLQSPGDGVECERCSKFFHLSCANTNSFSLFLMTNKVFKCPVICYECVVAVVPDFETQHKALRKRVKLELDWLKDLKEGQKSLPEETSASKEAEEDSKKESKEGTGKTDPPNKRGPAKTKQSKKSAEDIKAEMKNPEKYRTKVCSFYQRNACKNGRKCTYKHPPMCQKFKKHGPGPGGCNKQECNRLHPTICEKAWQTGYCSDGKCKLFHPGGKKSTAQIHTQNKSGGNKSQKNPKFKSNSFNFSKNFGMDPFLLKIQQMIEQAIDRRMSSYLQEV